MSIFKNSLNTQIQGQLKARGKAALDRNIHYFNSRNTFVRLTSGVDIEGLGSDLAKNYILQSGLLNKDNSLKSGIGSFKNAYSNYTLGIDGKEVMNQRGIRPMPGISKVSIKSLSAYGSMRSARVDFVCHDIKQLEILELLYMRPGFTVLLEWGWSPYLDNNGNLKNDIEFYNLFDEKGTFQERCTKLYKKSTERYQGNYDALLGYVKNYEWSARPDGGYDCWTEIMSIGEIMESLKINYTPNFKINVKKEGLIREKLNLLDPEHLVEEDNEKLEPFYKDNIVAAIIAELIAYSYEVTGKRRVNEGYAWSLSDTNGIVTGVKDSKMHFFRITINQNNNDGSGASKVNEKVSNIQTDEQFYIDLESFVNIFNKNIIVAQNTPEGKIGLISLSTKENLYESGEGGDLLCLSHPLQISVDPTICLVKNTTFKNIKNIKFESKPIDAISVPKNNLNNTDQASIAAKGVIQIFVSNISSNSNEFIQKSAIDNYLKVYLNKGISWDACIKNLSNAYENWKNLNFNNTSTRNVNVIQKIFSGTDSTRDKKLEDYINKSFTDVLIDEWDNNIDNTLKNFLNKYKLQGYIKDNIETKEQRIAFLNKKEFQADENIKVLTDESIRKQSAVLDINEKTSELKSDLSFLEKLTKEYFITLPDGSGVLGVIGNIYINLVYALSLAMSEDLKDQDYKEKREINLYDYFKNILSQVQGSIGSLNNFDIHVDPIDNVGRIIDINVVNEQKPEDVYNNAFTFLSDKPNEANAPLNGLFSNIRNYKWTSNITKDLSSIVAISAQNGGGQLGLDNETLVGFNKGIKDRIKPDIGPPLGPSYNINKNSPENSSILIQGLQNSLITISEFFKDLQYYDIPLISSIIDTERDFDSSNASKYKDALRDLLMTLKATTKTNSKFKAIIPTKLQLEIDGIGGLVIGHVIRMPNDLLPVGYKQDSLNNGPGRKLGYIITGIGHEIQDNDWVTIIETQTSILESPDEGLIGTFNFERALLDNNGYKVDTTNSNPILLNSSGSVQNNPINIKRNNKVGSTPYPGDLSFNTKYKNGFIPLTEMTSIGPGSTRLEYGFQFLLHPEAAQQYLAMKEAAKRDGIKWTITSAYRSYNHQKSLGSTRTVATAGSSPHGWGGAIDIGELYLAAKGSGNPILNNSIRNSNKLYKWLNDNGSKYNWYNPYRLADGSGIDECWHFEYWGPNVK